MYKSMCVIKSRSEILKIKDYRNGLFFSFFLIRADIIQESYRHEDESDEGEKVGSDTSLARDRNLSTLNENVIDDMDDSVRALDIWTDHSSSNILPFGKIFCINLVKKKIHSLVKHDYVWSKKGMQIKWHNN